MNNPFLKVLTKEEAALKKQIYEALWIRIHAMNLEITRLVESMDGMRQDMSLMGREDSKILNTTLAQMKERCDNLIKSRKALEEAQCSIYYNFGW
jgi:hypothetical protein